MRYRPELLEGISLENIYQIGYRGRGELKYSSGSHTKLNEDEQTDSFPWYYDYERSKVTRDEANNNYSETFVMNRDF